MTNTFKNAARILALTASLAGAGALHAQAPVQTQAPVKHHSVLKGAVVGAMAGHMTHRRHGSLIGAAVGAEVQHHRNVKARKMALKTGR